jgi:hypothetical protein
VTRVPTTSSFWTRAARSQALLLLGALGTGAILWSAPDARAHAIFMTYARHGVKVDAGPVNIDIHIELTFYEYPSLAERRRIDRDHNEAISETEIREYLAGLADTLNQAVSMEVDGRAVEVIPLFDPQVDLLGVEGVAPSHHVLKLSYFARTPKWLRSGSRIVLEERLWPATPRLGQLDIVNHDGVQVVAEQSDSPAEFQEGVEGPWRMPLRCETAPLKPTDQDIPAGAVADLSGGQSARTTGRAAGVLYSRRSAWIIGGMIVALLLAVGTGMAGRRRRPLGNSNRGG